MSRSCPPEVFPNIEAARDAAVTRRARRAAAGKRSGKRNVDARYCASHDGWHLVEARGKRKANSR